MQIETPPSAKPYDKPEGERRGIVIVNTGDGKVKVPPRSAWPCVRTARARR